MYLKIERYFEVEKADINLPTIKQLWMIVRLSNELDGRYAILKKDIKSEDDAIKLLKAFALVLK